MTYDFRKMDECDVFKAKLSHSVINFGFIPVWRMKRLLNFCLKHKLLYHPPSYFPGAFLVKHNFSYKFSGSTVAHLPFGTVMEWIADLFYKPELIAPLNGYVQRESILVKPRGTREGFTYVVWHGGLIR